MPNTRKAKPGSEHSNEPAAESAMSRDIINVPDNVLQEGTKRYSEAEQDAVQWAFTYGRTELGNSRERMCEVFGVDWTTLVRIAQGKYPASLRNFVRKVAEVQKRAADSTPAGFVETVVTRKIFDTLDYAVSGDIDGGRIVLISGRTGRSKTHAAVQWARLNNHGRAIYIDCPESGGLRALLQEIADRTGVNASRRTTDLRERIIKSFNRRRILIIDEILRLLPTRRSVRLPVELEFIRRLHDVTHCAIALVATPVFEQEMNEGWLKVYLEQLLGRIDEPLSVPDRVYESEAREICAHYCGRKPAEDLVKLAHQLANQPGRLRLLFKLLRQAATVARKLKEPLQKKHLEAAYQRRRERLKWPAVSTLERPAEDKAI